MIIQAIAHLFSLDFGWFIGLAMDNLLWVAIFYATANILGEGKSFLGTIWLFLFFVYDLFTELSFAQASGWVLLGSGFLALLYTSRTAISIWIESTPSLKRHMLKILSIHWLGVYIIYNVFMT